MKKKHLFLQTKIFKVCDYGAELATTLASLASLRAPAKAGSDH